jgi:hypothetical protein
MKTGMKILLALLTLIALYLMYAAAKPPVRVQADADQKSIPGFSITSTDVFAA